MDPGSSTEKLVRLKKKKISLERLSPKLENVRPTLQLWSRLNENKRVMALGNKVTIKKKKKYVSSSLYLNDFQRFFFPNRLRRLLQTSMFAAMRSDFCLLAEASLPWEMPLTNGAGHLSQP